MSQLFENTKFFQATLKIFKKIDDSLQGVRDPVKVFIAGGVAVHLWTACRVSIDIDAIFSQRIVIPQELVAFYYDEKMDKKAVQFDYTYSYTFGLLHPDFEIRAKRLQNGNYQNIVLHVLDPYDLAITKLSRFDERDKEDIQELIGNDLIQNPEWLEKLASEVLDYLVGPKAIIEYNINEVLEWMDNDAQLSPK